MKKYSFIDFGLKDFIRDTVGDTLILMCNNYEEAEDWLLKNGSYYGWTNKGVRYWCWDEEE
jgi:hypothetical protein